MHVHAIGDSSPPNTLLKQEGLQLAEASFRDLLSLSICMLEWLPRCPPNTLVHYSRSTKAIHFMSDDQMGRFLRMLDRGTPMQHWNHPLRAGCTGAPIFASFLGTKPQAHKCQKQTKHLWFLSASFPKNASQCFSYLLIWCFCPSHLTPVSGHLNSPPTDLWSCLVCVCVAWSKLRSPIYVVQQST